MRIGIASILQETNTFSVIPTRLDAFTVAVGEAIFDIVADTNSELAGAARVIEEAGAEVIPLVYAWAMPSGRVEEQTYDRLVRLLADQLEEAGRLDGLVLSLHGSMAAVGHDDADGDLLEKARSVVGAGTPLAVSLDLHANVTRKMVDLADSISAYHTDPHVDMAEAGARSATRAMSMASSGGRPHTGYAKRPLIIPAETMNTDTGLLAEIRHAAVANGPEGLVELCLFPVQPWLDVPELGFAVVTTANAQPETVDRFTREVADEVWARRHEFTIERFLEPDMAMRAAIGSDTRPFIIAESADAPTAGATGDSPVMVGVAARDAGGLMTYIPVVDPAAVAVCHDAGVGQTVRLPIGASIDTRWWDPVVVEACVLNLGEGSYRLEGASFTGMSVTMGRFATLAVGPTRVLVSERPAWTSDPATFRFAGLDPDLADVIVVRSCSDFRPNFPASARDAVTLDVPGAATPRLTNLRFEKLEQPPFPLAEWTDQRAGAPYADGDDTVL